MDEYRSVEAEKSVFLSGKDKEREGKWAKPGRVCSAFWWSSSGTAQKEPNRQSIPEFCFCMMGSHYYAINHSSDRLIIAALTAPSGGQCRPEIRAMSIVQQRSSTDVWNVYMGRTAVQAYPAQPSLKDTSDVNDWMKTSRKRAGGLYYRHDQILMIQYLVYIRYWPTL